MRTRWTDGSSTASSLSAWANEGARSGGSPAGTLPSTSTLSSRSSASAREARIASKTSTSCSGMGMRGAAKKRRLRRPSAASTAKEQSDTPSVATCVLPSLLSSPPEPNSNSRKGSPWATCTPSSLPICDAAMRIAAAVLALGASQARAVPSATDVAHDRDMCTAILVGPAATVDGGTMTTHNADCLNCDYRIARTAAKVTAL